MVKKLLLLSLLFLAALQLKAQVPDPCPSNNEPAADDCATACIYCNFNGYSGTTAGYTGGFAGGFCGTIENEQWLGFIAGASSATFTATASNCVIGNGVQIALYDDCNGVPVPNGCNGGCAGCAGNPVSISVALTPGVNYFLLIDGYAGDQCDFTISVAPPNAVIAPPVGTIGAISGPTNVCPGAVVVYSTPVVTGAGAYIWTAPSGYLINGQGSPLTVNAPGGNVVTVTIGPNNGQLCVTAINSCDQTNPIVCKNIIVTPIPPTTIPPVSICAEDVPYETPWGAQVSTSGLYQTTLDSWLGCDSIVRQQVNIKAPIVKFLPPQTVCAGTCITICGQSYCDGGSFTTVCDSYQGCDSSINFSILVLDPVAEILGNTVLSCATTSLLLSSTPTPNGTKIWKNLTGNILGVGNTLTVTQPGTVILNVSATAGGVTCAKADTVVITGNTTPPTLSVTNGILGCGASSTILTTTTNASPPTYVWTGPNSFTSNAPNPTVTVSGMYTVTVTNQTNGCTSSATANVTGNTTPPTASATGGTLTCATLSTQITASSNVGNATYVWSGPNSFTSNIFNPTVSLSGTYTVTVTNPANNCTATTTTSVALNNTPPGASASVTGIIGCTTPMVTLNGTSPAPGSIYAWSGPSFTSNQQNPQADTAGLYTVTVTGTNGCTSTANTTVTGNTILPNASATGGTVSCGTQMITLGGGSTTPSVTYAWTGPAGYTASVQNPQASLTGSYIVTVTAPNTCTNTATAIVAGDFAVPNASATGGIITCASSTTTITGASTTNGSSFDWAGPGNFMSNLPVETVNTVGDYILTVTGPNGCTTTATATVAPDANIPNASASGGTLDCTVSSLVISGNSTTPGATLVWSGPNSFTSNLPSPTVSDPGSYILTVTNPANGCTALATANVNLDDVAPGATATGDTITCTLPTITLVGNTQASNVSWSWTGPGAFTSTSQNPTTIDAGTYNLTVTGANGCTSVATVDVAADQIIPQASATTGTLTCAQATLVLNGSATLPVTYSWDGPNNFISNQQDPSINQPGDYTVTVTAANGCTDVETVTVAQDIAPPGVTTTGNTLDCNNPQVQISASTVATGSVSYIWNTGGTAPMETVAVNGDYTVTVTGPNGCTSVGAVLVQIDTVTAALQASAPTALSCAATTVNIQTNVFPGSSPVQSLSWTGPNSFTSTLEDPAVVDPGVYTLVATTANGCTSQTQATVGQDIIPPTASATGGTVTCVILSTQLNGGSTTPGASYSWSGPNSFASNTEDPIVNDAGTYTLTVTAPNGCITVITTTVILDAVIPDVAAVSTNNLDCDDLSTTLQGSSQTSGIIYAWSGTNFNSTQQAPVTAVPDVYTLTVTASNGCTATTSVTVTQDIAIPNITAQGDTVDCITGQTPILANSTTPGVIYLWSGPNNFNSTLQSPIVSQPGAYQVTVTGLNACTATASAQVEQNISSPQVVLAGGGTVTCAQTDVTITGTINTPGANGVWSGPNSFSSAQAAITVSVPGIYTYTVTAVNGCISAPTSTVLLNTQTPQGVITTGGLLNCTFPTITITANSTTSGVTYAWSGPGGYTSTQQNPNDITNPGLYDLVVTNPVNGCMTAVSAIVTQDPTVPDIAVTTSVITCSLPTVVLDATTTTPNVGFQWSGPNGFTSTQQDPANISTPGSYTVIATATSGCTASFNVNVLQDTALPGASATGVTISCAAQSGVITSTSATPGVTYLWGGPAGFSSPQPSPTVTLVGTYTVTITAANGCISTAEAIVLPDINAPQLTATGGTLTCLVSNITLNATANVGVVWQWSGPAGFSSTQPNPSVSTAGNYIVIATATNGCSVSSGVTVLANTNGPSITLANPKELNCTTTQVPLSVSVQGSGNFTYAWTGASILSGGNSPNPTVSQAGLYEVVVTDTQNGCTTNGEVQVAVNTDTPSSALLDGKDVNCFGQTNGSISVGAVTGGTPPYLYSLDNSPFTSGSVFTSLAPKTYNLVIQDANGCEYETVISIGEPNEIIVDLGPDTIIHLGQNIGLSLADITNEPDRIEEVQVNPGGIFPANGGLDTTLLPTYSFRYTVTVVDSNGCKASDMRLVIVDKTRYVYIPNIFDPASNDNNIFMIFGGEDVVKIKTFQVFDRWGDMVHEFYDFFPNTPSSGWDGKVKGQLANPAVFVYYAEILFKDGETVLFKGDVLLQR